MKTSEFFIFLLLLFAGNYVNAQIFVDSVQFSRDNTIPALVQERKIVWDYPVKPGSKQWTTFTTSKQLLEACQIPQNVLDTLSTNDLAEICFNYPLFFEYTAFNDEREGINIRENKKQNTIKSFIRNYNNAEPNLLREISKTILEL